MVQYVRELSENTFLLGFYSNWQEITSLFCWRADRYKNTQQARESEPKQVLAVFGIPKGGLFFFRVSQKHIVLIAGDFGNLVSNKTFFQKSFCVQKVTLLLLYFYFSFTFFLLSSNALVPKKIEKIKLVFQKTLKKRLQLNIN